MAMEGVLIGLPRDACSTSETELIVWFHPPVTARAQFLCRVLECVELLQYARGFYLILWLLVPRLREASVEVERSVFARAQADFMPVGQLPRPRGVVGINFDLHPAADLIL